MLPNDSPAVNPVAEKDILPHLDLSQQSKKKAIIYAMNVEQDIFKSLAENLSGGEMLIHIPTHVLWWSFGIIAILTTIISIVLLYHWSAYGYKAVKTGFMASLYLLGTLFLISGIFFGISSYILSI